MKRSSLFTFVVNIWGSLATQNKSISSLAAIATTIGIGFAAIQIYQTSKSLEASTIYQVQRDGRDLFTSLRQNRAVLDYIYNYQVDISYDPKVVTDAELAMAEIVQYFSSVFNQRRNGVITDDYWDTFAEEICAFITRPAGSAYWEKKVKKGKYSNAFKDFGNRCLS